MAKIKLGAIVTQISGKLGGHVFARNAGGAYMRTNATPSNPQTSFQTAVRAFLAGISSAWSGLANAARNGWNDATDDFSRTDQFGDIRKLSGKALFQSLNQNLLLTEQATITTAPLPSAVPSALIQSADGDETGQLFTITTGGDTSGAQLLIWATPSLSQGTSFVKNRLRSIGTIAGSVAGNVDIAALYAARFGVIAEDVNIHVGITVVNSKGQAAPREVVKAVIIAS